MDAKLHLSQIILNPLSALKIGRFAYSPTRLLAYLQGQLGGI